MQTTVGALVHAEAALVRLAEQTVTFKAAYHVRKLLKLVYDETRFFHEQRDRLVIDNGFEREPTPLERLTGPAGKRYDIAPDKIDVVNAQIAELSSVPVILEQWLLTPTLLADYKVSAADIAALGDLIVADERS